MRFIRLSALAARPAGARHDFIRGASPLGLPYWLARGGPLPRSARQAHSHSLARLVHEMTSSLSALAARPAGARQETEVPGMRHDAFKAPHLRDCYVATKRRQPVVAAP